MNTEEHLSMLVSDGVKVRELLRHPGMELLRRMLEDEAGKDYRKWALELDRDKAEELRHRAQGYELFFNYAKGVILRAQEAERHLQNLQSQKFETHSDTTPA